MFRKVLLALGLLLLCSANAFCQSTTVSGTITDAGAQTWNNGTFNFVFVPSAVNPVGPYSWTGGTLPTNIGGSLSGTGTYSVSIPSNTAISPIQTAWTATFCPQASSPCFTVSNITITGATQTLNATPPTILINLQSAQPPVLAYTNSEISGAALGSQYFNLVSGTLQTCTAISGNNCTTWSSAGTATNATNLVGPGAITGSFSGTHTETGNVTLQGNNTHSGTETFTGALNTARLAAEIYPSGLAGATCGDKIAAALALLPANGGVLSINQACGTGTATTPWTAVAIPGFVTLRFVEPGVYWISGITQSTVGGNFGAAIIGLPCSKTSGGSPQQCPVELHMGNGLNNPFGIKMGMADGSLRDIVVDGNASNNPTGGVGVLASAGSLEFSNVTIQNNPTHGLFFAGVGTTHNADGSRVKSVWILNNKADGVYAANAADLQWGESSTSLLNGTVATVNTTSTTITATSGSWSTDSSLVGTMVRVNNSGMCQILAVPSTTTFTVAVTTCWNSSGVPTALGVQSGVPMVFGNAWEANNSPTTRFSHGELSTSKMDAFLGYGTSSGFGSHRQIFNGGIQFGNEGNHDIEIINSCLDNQALNCALGSTIVGNNFIGSQQRTASAGTYDFIKLVDLTNSDIAGNTFTASAGGNQEKAVVEQVESAGSRVNGTTTIGVNQVVGALFTSPYIDNTVLGTFGAQFPVHAGQNSSVDIFNAAPGTALPHKYIATANDGSLRIINNAFNVTLFQLNDSGAAFFPSGAVQGGGFLPNAAGGSDLGSISLPHANLWLGTAATSNFKFQPAATAAARIISIPDPLGATNLVLTPAAGTVRSSLHISDQGTACANGNIVLSAGWGTTATTTAAAGQGQTCQFTLTSSGTGQAATPTITDTLPTALPSASVVCTAQMVGGTGANTLINQTTLSATAPVFTFAGTPGAASTYFVVIRCGP